ncbi:MAG: hypothetical protein ABL893_19690, partial [Hyphomicrobium sp.]
IHCGDGLIYGALPDLQREISEATDGTGVLHFIASSNLLITARRDTLNAPGIVRKTLLDGAQYPQQCGTRASCQSTQTRSHGPIDGP